MSGDRGRGSGIAARARAADAFTRAYQHRDRLSERERYLAESSYFSSATDELQQAIRPLQNMIALDSTDSYALNNLGVVYARMLDNVRSESLYLAAARADSNNALSWLNAVAARTHQGKFEEAHAMLEQVRSRFPGNVRLFEFSAYLEAAQRNYEAAERMARAQRDSARGNAAILLQSTMILSGVTAARGRVSEAKALITEAARQEEERGRAPQALQRRIDNAALDVFVRCQPAAALAALEEALRRQPLSELHVLERPYSELALIYATTGRTERARQLLDEYDANVDNALRHFIERLAYRMARSALATAEGKSGGAIQAARAAQVNSGCQRCPLPMLARAFEAAGQPDSVIATYESYLATSHMYALDIFDRWHLGETYERLGQLYDAKRNAQKAAEFYSRFVELWKDADPELQPRVTAARNRLAELVVRRG